MRRSLLLAAVISVSTPQIASAAVVVEYKFDGNGADTSGNGLNATLFNGATYGEGKFGQALSLDGINDYAASAFTNLALSAFTFEAWINVPTYGLNVHYISLFQGSNYIVLGDYANGVVSTWADGLNPVMLIGGSESTSVNDWHHIAFSWDGSIQRVYLDGALVDSKATSGSLTGIYNQGLVVGARYSKDTQFVRGSIDNVRISDVALSSSQLGFFTDGLSAVPEPATWATMLLGFGLIGAGMRYRRRHRVRVTYA